MFYFLLTFFEMLKFFDFGISYLENLFLGNFLKLSLVLSTNDYLLDFLPE